MINFTKLEKNTNEYKLVFVRYAVLCALGVFSLSAQADVANNEKTTSHSKVKVVKLKKIEKKYRKLLVGEKNIASAMSVISQKQIENGGTAASIYSILKLSPSVNEYQQNIGPSMPVLTIRGVRMSQLAQTLDGVPMTSLLSGGVGALNTYGIGSLVSTGQVSGVHIYPGVAPPDRAGFATIGGTVNYHSKQPTAKKYADIFTKIGSFSTDVFGAQINSGKIPKTGGLELLARYSNTQTAGYIQHTPSRYSDFLFSAKRPYDYGLSKVFATVIYNKGNGYESDYSGYPVALQKENGLFYNVPLSQTSTQQFNSFLTAIVGDNNYINRHLVVSGRVFYIHKNSKFEAQTDPSVIGLNYPYQNNYYTPVIYDGTLGGNDAPNNDFSYNPITVFGSYHAGESAGINYANSSTIGFTPKVNIFLDHNDITLGGLIAAETGHISQYVYGNLKMPQINGYNAYEYGIKEHRVVYSGYAQDKLNLFNNTLHIEPGVTLTGVSSSNYVPQNVFASPDHPYTLSNYDKAILPYLGISYDITKHIIAYGSYGKGVRFAPIEDYTLGVSGSSTKAPGPETVNAYEAGLRYVSKRLYLNLDGYWQNEHGVFSFSTDPLTDYSSYLNIGDIQIKGLEASGKYYLTKHLLLSGNASYTQANYLTSFFVADSPSGVQYGYANAGDPLTNVPNWLANLSLDYHNKNFSAELSGNYTGTMTATYDTTLPDSVWDKDPTGYGPNIPWQTTPNPAMRFGDYFLLNLAASYKIKTSIPNLRWVKVFLNVQNILNTHYYVHYDQIYKTYDSSVGQKPYYVDYPGLPRFMEIGVEGHFI